MTEQQWHRRADRQMALWHALNHRLQADSSAWNEAMERGIGEVFAGSLDPYGEAKRLSESMKRTRERISRLQARMLAHADTMLDAWQPDVLPS